MLEDDTKDMIVKSKEIEFFFDDFQTSIRFCEDLSIDPFIRIFEASYNSCEYKIPISIEFAKCLRGALDSLIKDGQA